MAATEWELLSTWSFQCMKCLFVTNKTHLTLRNVLSSEHLQWQGGPSQSHTSWQQQIALYVILIVIWLPFLHLQYVRGKNRKQSISVLEGCSHHIYMRKEEATGASESDLSCESYRGLVSGPHYEEADFEVAFSPGAGVIRVVQQEPFPHDTVGCNKTHINVYIHILMIHTKSFKSNWINF